MTLIPASFAPRAARTPAPSPARAPRRALQTGAFATAGLILLLLFNLALPKGGIKVNNLPLTWGYALLLAATPLGLFSLKGRRHFDTTPITQFLTCFLPTIAMILAKAVIYSMQAQDWLIYVVILGVLPGAVLVCLAPFLEDIPAATIGRTIVWTVRFAALWGLMNFVLRIFTGQFIEVPYLTVNADDIGEIFRKMNDRAGVMKLVSTYNNGNVFGICMIIVAPLYLLFENRRVLAGLFLLALVCTLSRTVWFGMVATALLMILAGHIRVANPLVWIGALIPALAVVFLLPVIGWTPDKLLDTSLGGRNVYFTTYKLTAFGSESLQIPELIYVGFAQSFGILGMLFPLAGLFFAPVHALMRWASLSKLRQAAAIGTGGYLITALIDGAFVLPPTLVLFLFASAMIYRRGLHPDVQASARRQVSRRGSVFRAAAR